MDEKEQRMMRARWMLRSNPRAQALIARIQSLTPEQRTKTPFPPEWTLYGDTMILLVDAGYLGMDGFQYQFREYAEQCWRVCHQ